MIIDCNSCVMEHTSACDDCVVTAFLGLDEGPVFLEPSEELALTNLADAGLVAPIRLVPRRDRPHGGRSASG